MEPELNNFESATLLYTLNRSKAEAQKIKHKKSCQKKTSWILHSDFKQDTWVSILYLPWQKELALHDKRSRDQTEFVIKKKIGGDFYFGL